MKYYRLVFAFFLLVSAFSVAAARPTLPPDSRTVMEFSFGRDQAVEFKTGNGAEGFAFFRKNDEITCRFTDAKGKAKNILYRMNGVARRNFNWHDNLLAWSSVYEQMFAKDPVTAVQKVVIENNNGTATIFLNGVALESVPAIAGVILPEKKNVRLLSV